MMVGTIARWGTKGFGFVEAEGLPSPAWTHAEYLADGAYEPRRGDRVEFELVRLADGRLQARRVRPLSVPITPTPQRSDPRTSATTPSMGTLGEKLAAASGVVALVRPAPSRIGIGLQIAERRRARDTERASIMQQAAKLRRESEQLLARARDLAAEADRHEDDLDQRRVAAERDDDEIVKGYLTTLCESFERALEDKARLQRAADRARAVAVDRVGAQAVSDYDEVRDRLAVATDSDDRLGRAAFEMLEKDRRSALREYAGALDALARAPQILGRFVAFIADGTTTLVAPIAVAAPLPTGSVITRIACAFWQAAERAATELGGRCTVEDGAVGGLLAVRFPLQQDAALLEVLIDETISTRPSLDAMGIEPAFEMAENIAVRFDAVDEEKASSDTAASGGVEGGRSLPEVAARLGLSLRDAVAALHDAGLPFLDDDVEPGAEDTLRVLLGEVPAPALEAEASPPLDVTPAAAGEIPLAGNIALASRMLAKLLRDRRVGGRHTRMDNAWGHHFADEEKQPARLVAEWLERDGIFLSKDNEHSHHISINPRRLRDVHEIIEGSWGRRDELRRG